MKAFKNYLLVFVAIFSWAFSSCSSQIAGTVRNGGAAGFNVNTRIEPRTADFIRTFLSFSGPEAKNQEILNGETIGKSMAAAPGMGKVALENTGPAAIKGTVELVKVEDFLAVAGRNKRFITYTEAAENRPGQGSIIVSIDRETAPAVIALLSADAVAYLSALMAPAATGEVLSRHEYLFIVGSFYGQAIADEIIAAKINASIDFPGRIINIRGGTSSGRRAEFQIPLIDLLVLEKPLVWEVSWEK